MREKGTDGKLVRGPDGPRGRVFHASLAEKLLTLMLAKLANLVPEGGLWMNTQRPEWNDANNALVGKGLSMVTLGYLRRYIVFARDLLAGAGLSEVHVSSEVMAFWREVAEVLARLEPALAAASGNGALADGAFGDERRRALMDALGEAGSRYRWQFL